MPPKRNSAVSLPERKAWPAGAVFTIGHSTLALERFLAILQTYGIDCLVDIRTVPRSRYNPQFNADTLITFLHQNGIGYAHMDALGGLRHARKDSPNTGWRNKSFQGYADYMQTAGFAEGLSHLIGMAREQRVAIMCAEAVPWRCHRSLVADALNVRDIQVIDILSETSHRLHKLTPFARVNDMMITYPPPPSPLK